MNNKFNPFTKSVESTVEASEGLAPAAQKIYEFLQQGNTINFVQAHAMGITQLGGHIANIKAVAIIHTRFIRINGICCQEYSLQPF